MKKSSVIYLSFMVDNPYIVKNQAGDLENVFITTGPGTLYWGPVAYILEGRGTLL